MHINYSQIYEQYYPKRLPPAVKSRITKKIFPRKNRHHSFKQEVPTESDRLGSLIIYASTDCGTKDNNEDSFCIYNVKNTIISDQGSSESYTLKIDSENTECILLAVADGISSLPDSQKASSAVIHQLIERYPTLTLENGKYIRRVFQSINRLVSKTNSGTTLAMILIDQNQAYCANTGDSAIYLIRNNTIYQISVDDTAAREMLDEGFELNLINQDLLHTLTRYIGQPELADPHIQKIKLNHGDLLIVMSDAFTPDINTLIPIISRKGNIAHEMISYYKDNRTDYYMDNSTVIIIFIN